MDDLDMSMVRTVRDHAYDVLQKLSHEASVWSPEQTYSEITVSDSPVEGLTGAFFGVIDIRASVEVVHSILLDGELRKEWDPQVISAKVVSSVADEVPNTEFIQLLVHVPVDYVENRELVFLRSYKKTSNPEGVVSVAISIDHPQILTPAGYKRGALFSGYILRSMPRSNDFTGAGECTRLLYMVQSDAKGKTPSWVLNLQARTAIQKPLSALKNVCEKRAQMILNTDILESLVGPSATSTSLCAADSPSTPLPEDENFSTGSEVALSSEPFRMESGDSIPVASLEEVDESRQRSGRPVSISSSNEHFYDAHDDDCCESTSASAPSSIDDPYISSILLKGILQLSRVDRNSLLRARIIPDIGRIRKLKGASSIRGTDIDRTLHVAVIANECAASKGFRSFSLKLAENALSSTNHLAVSNSGEVIEDLVMRGALEVQRTRKFPLFRSEQRFVLSEPLCRLFATVPPRSCIEELETLREKVTADADGQSRPQILSIQPRVCKASGGVFMVYSTNSLEGYSCSISPEGGESSRDNHPLRSHAVTASVDVVDEHVAVVMFGPMDVGVYSIEFAANTSALGYTVAAPVCITIVPNEPSSFGVDEYPQLAHTLVPAPSPVHAVE